MAERERIEIFIRRCDGCGEQVPCKPAFEALSIVVTHRPLNGPHHAPDCPGWRDEPGGSEASPWRPGTERPPERETLLFAKAGDFYTGFFVVTGDPEHDFYWSHEGPNGSYETKRAPDWWMPISPVPEGSGGGKGLSEQR